MFIYNGKTKVRSSRRYLLIKLFHADRALGPLSSASSFHELF